MYFQTPAKLRNDRINAIIKKWGRKYSDNSNELLFNIIEEYDDAETARKKFSNLFISLMIG